MVLRAIVVWLGLMVAAIANGAVRETLIRPRLGEYAGHVISTVILCAVIVLTSIASISWIGPSDLHRAFLVGVLWVSLTLAFESIAGHYVFGNPWEKLLADYNILRGRVWILVLIATLLSPVLAARIKGS